MKCSTCLDGYDETFTGDCPDCGKRDLGKYPTDMSLDVCRPDSSTYLYNTLGKKK